MFEKEVIECILQYNPTGEIVDGTCKTIVVRDKNMAFHLIAIPFDGLHTIHRTYFQEKTLEYAEQGIKLVHLWQDGWVKHRDIVRSRVAVLSGTFQRIPARQTMTWRIAKDVAHDFLMANHLQGAVKARYNYGLYYECQLVAVASFSAGRPITRDGVEGQSFELIRYANLLHYRVVGGLGKLISRFIKDEDPDDIMTYADLDWAPGKGYQALKFERIDITPPQIFWVNPAEMIRYYPHRLPTPMIDEFNKQKKFGNIGDFLKNKGYIKIYNAGNLKYLLMCGK